MRMRSIASLLLLAVGVTFSTGSAWMRPKPHGEFRQVKKTPEGGVVALSGDPTLARQAAEQSMTAHCGAGNYQITAEEEVVVGKDEASHTDTTAGSRSTSSGTSTSSRDATEVRLTYVCGGAATTPPPAEGTDTTTPPPATP